MTQKLAHINGLCFDFDGVLYDLSGVPNICEISDMVIAESALSVLDNQISYQQAKKMARAAYIEYGASVTAFSMWAADRGLDADDITDRIFHSYHQKMHDQLLEHAPHIFVPTPHIIQSFEKCKGVIANGIASHGSIQNYALPILQSKELSGYFTQHALFGLNDGGYNRKSENTHLVQKCLNALNSPLQESGYVEDNLTNLKVAKDEHPELTTVFIHHGNFLKDKPAHVDFQFHDVGELNNAIHTAKTNDHPIILL